MGFDSSFLSVARHIVLLRGVNLVKRNRVSMPTLRSALEAAGYHDVRTYLQSGNIVVSSRASAERVTRDVKKLVKERFGLDIAVFVRSADDLAKVVRRNPLHSVATNPRRYLVTFLSRPLPAGIADELAKLATGEKLVVAGREVYSWHPEGIGRTPVWERLASRSLGVEATSRNWTTVETLLAMATERTSR